MDDGAKPLVCDKCGHFDWDRLRKRLVRASSAWKISLLLVPPSVYEHMASIANASDEYVLFGGPGRRLQFRGVDVQQLEYYEPVPLPRVPGETFVCVFKDGNILYQWIGKD